MKNKGDFMIFAVADCTGHGVAGAILSVICNTAINRSVGEFGLVKPEQILDKTRELVIKTFEKSDEEIKEGMDIAICTLNKKTNKLYYAGANNSMYYVSKETLTEIKADKQPIGKYEHTKPFTSHKIQLVSGDLVYLFSDGFPDQFGGPKDRKFMYKPFRQLLLNNSRKTMEEQQEILSNTFENWKGNGEQIDDVCVVGIKVL